MRKFEIKFTCVCAQYMKCRKMQLLPLVSSSHPTPARRLR